MKCTGNHPNLEPHKCALRQIRVHKKLETAKRFYAKNNRAGENLTVPDSCGHLVTHPAANKQQTPIEQAAPGSDP